MSGAYAVLHDPQGLLDAELPLDRAPHEALVTAVLAWKDPDLAPSDYEQIALQLTGHARAVAADVRWPPPSPRATAAAPSPKSSSGRPKAAWPPRSRAPPRASRTTPGSCGRSTPELDRLTEPAPATT